MKCSESPCQIGLIGIGVQARCKTPIVIQEGIHIAINFDFGSIKEKMGNLARAGVAQGKKVASIAKLKADNMAQQDAIRKAYFAIGKAYYAKMQGSA